MIDSKFGREDLTRERLMREFYYDWSTGVFIRHTQTHKLSRRGIAGWVDANGYVIISCFGHAYKAHRLAWLYAYGGWPVGVIDHINRCKTDNRLCNLRDVDRVENARNRWRSANNTSGTTNVYFYKKYGKWRARTRFNGKDLGLGYFSTQAEALDALISFEMNAHGRIVSNMDVPGEEQK